MSKSEPINLDPRIWGSHAWFFLESICIALPNKINKKLETELKHCFLSLTSLLPCEACRMHYSKYLMKTDITNIDFSNKAVVLKWINNLHNKVRIRTGKEPGSIDRMVGYYNIKYNIDTTTSYKDIGIIILFILLLLFLIRLLHLDRIASAAIAPIVPVVTKTFAPIASIASAARASATAIASAARGR
jgi:hypothetical protein